MGWDVPEYSLPDRARPSVVLPLSSAQLGLWLAQRFSGDVPITISQYVEINGDFDPVLMDRVASTAAREFESGMLRITEIDGVPHQVVDETLDCTTGYVDLRGTQDPVAAATEWMRRSSAAPLDVHHDRLVSASVLQLADRHFYWYARIHHIALDGFGAMNFMNRAAELYTAATRGETAPQCRAGGLAAIVASDRSYQDSSRYRTDRDYWSEQTVDLPPPPTLAGRGPAPLSARALISSATLTLHRKTGSGSGAAKTKFCLQKMFWIIN